MEGYHILCHQALAIDIAHAFTFKLDWAIKCASKLGRRVLAHHWHLCPCLECFAGRLNPRWQGCYSPHLPENVVISRLEGDVEELTHLWELCTGPHKPVSEVSAST